MKKIILFAFKDSGIYIEEQTEIGSSFGLKGYEFIHHEFRLVSSSYPAIYLASWQKEVFVGGMGRRLGFVEHSDRVKVPSRAGVNWQELAQKIIQTGDAYNNLFGSHVSCVARMSPYWEDILVGPEKLLPSIRSRF